MAERRMFAKSIIDSDLFLEMPASTQMLYFHLSMRADDDGFVNNPKRIMRMVGASEDDMKVLIAKQFILVFDSGVIVIRHWKIHNYIQNDRYKRTINTSEKSMLMLDGSGSYSMVDTGCIHDGYTMDTQDRIGKVSIDKDNKERTDTKVSVRKKFVPPTVDEVNKHIEEKGYHFDAEAFIAFYESNGWMVGKNKMKSWKAACITWEQKYKKPTNKSGNGRDDVTFAIIDSWGDDK